VTTNLPETTARVAELPHRDPLPPACRIALTLNCPHCGAGAWDWCDGVDGLHMHRFVQAYVAGRLTLAHIEAAVQAAGDVFHGGTIIRDGAS
jgi:hypothetical protein